MLLVRRQIHFNRIVRLLSVLRYDLRTVGVQIKVVQKSALVSWASKTTTAIAAIRKQRVHPIPRLPESSEKLYPWTDRFDLPGG